MCLRISYFCPVCRVEHLQRFNTCARLNATPGLEAHACSGATPYYLGPLPDGMICNSCLGVGPQLIPLPKFTGALHKMVKVPANMSPTGKEEIKVVEMNPLEDAEYRRRIRKGDPALAAKHNL